jgi:hypothetical protein
VSERDSARELEELREAAGAVAHDLGNSLQVILGRTFLLEHKLGNATVSGDLAAITRAAEEAVELTGRLMELGIKRD